MNQEGKISEREAFVAFNLTDKVGSVKLAELVAAAGSASAAWETYPFKVARSGGEIDWKREFSLAKRYGVEIVTPVDAAYPPQLLEQPSHPLALYVKGDASLLSSPSVAIVGTRRATPYGLDQSFKIAKGLAEEGWVVVSGLALGIDAESHRGALAAEGKTVGVIGSGLDEFYPEENRALAREIVEKGGAVVSEFPFGRSPDTQTFPQRNHTVAALARGVVAIEAPFKSGTLITTSCAADMGRVVMALPGRVDSRSSAGCLQLPASPGRGWSGAEAEAQAARRRDGEKACAAAAVLCRGVNDNARGGCRRRADGRPNQTDRPAGREGQRALHGPAAEGPCPLLPRQPRSPAEGRLTLKMEQWQ